MKNLIARTGHRTAFGRWFLALLALAVLFGCDVPVKHYGALLDAEISSLRVLDHYPRQFSDIAYVPNGNDFQRLDLYRPAGEDPAPVMVFIHGGYWMSGSRKEYAALAGTLCPRGFVTILVDYRLYPDVTYPAFMEDCAAALNWVMANVADYGGDPDRVFVAGHSAGGHIVSLLATHPRFRAMLKFDPLKLRGVIPLSGAYDFVNGNTLDLGIVRQVMVTPENFADAQPIRHVRADVPPMLMVNGDRDNLTSEPQAAAFALAMQRAGAPLRYAKIKGGDHHSVVVDMAPGRDGPALRAVLQFMNEQLKQRSDPTKPVE